MRRAAAGGPAAGGCLVHSTRRAWGRRLADRGKASPSPPSPRGPSLAAGTLARTQIGTPHYMPPEVWKGRPYSFTSDSWALGCLLYEMVALKVPFEARSMSELKLKVGRHRGGGGGGQQRGRCPVLPGTAAAGRGRKVRRGAGRHCRQAPQPCCCRLTACPPWHCR
jgi:serine/threonine protein kinase